jgi:hypothetical protein
MKNLSYLSLEKLERLESLFQCPKLRNLDVVKNFFQDVEEAKNLIVNRNQYPDNIPF